MSAEEVSQDRTVSVREFLPSEGYEHADNPEWRARLEELLE